MIKNSYVMILFSIFVPVFIILNIYSNSLGEEAIYRVINAKGGEVVEVESMYFNTPFHKYRKSGAKISKVIYKVNGINKIAWFDNTIPLNCSNDCDGEWIFE